MNQIVSTQWGPISLHTEADFSVKNDSGRKLMGLHCKPEFCPKRLQNLSCDCWTAPEIKSSPDKVSFPTSKLMELSRKKVHLTLWDSFCLHLSFYKISHLLISYFYCKFCSVFMSLKPAEGRTQHKNWVLFRNYLLEHIVEVRFRIFPILRNRLRYSNKNVPIN